MTMPDSETAIMRVKLRECRLVTERLCQSIGVPDAMLPCVTICGVYSAALGLAGFAGMERQLDRLTDVRPERMSASVDDGIVRFCAGGQHAWVAAEPALDMLVAAYRIGNATRMIMSDALEARELGVIRGLAERHHLRAQVEMDDDGVAAVDVSARPLGEATVLDRIIHEGIAVEHDLWFQLFHRSHDALAPDTVISRTHTGSIIVRPDGTIVGKADPEFIDMDLSMLTKDSLIRLEKTGTRAND